jgi:glutathione synthase
MKIAYLTDNLTVIHPLDDSTSHLMYECNQRGHTVYFLEPHDVYIRGNAVVARMRDVSAPAGLSMERYWHYLVDCLKREELIFETLTDLDAMVFRKSPPFNYQLMEFLGPVQEDIFILNSITGQIIGSNKIFTLNFPDIIPETHVSRDPKRLKKIIDDFGGTMLIKPLQRFDGQGVIKVTARDRENLNSLIHYYVKAFNEYPNREPIMVQEYLEQIRSEGDVRILLLNGEILGAVRRIPGRGDFRVNGNAKAAVSSHRASKSEKMICDAIKGVLIQKGLYLVSIDIVGDRLVGINCTCPGEIPLLNRLDGVRLEATVVDFIERQID